MSNRNKILLAIVAGWLFLLCLIIEFHSKTAMVIMPFLCMGAIAYLAVLTFEFFKNKK